MIGQAGLEVVDGVSVDGHARNWHAGGHPLLQNWGRKPRALVSPDSIIPTCWNPSNQDCIVYSWVPGIVCLQEPSESLLGKSFHVLLSHPFLTSQWLWASLGHWEDNICLKPQQMIRCLLAGSPSLRARSASCLLWTSEDSPLPFP